MNSEQNYGSLQEVLGEDIRVYADLEHRSGRGEGKAVIDPHKGMYEDTSTETVSDFVLKATELVYEFIQGVDQYEVEGSGELSAEEAVEEIIGQELPDSPQNNLRPLNK